MEEEYDKLFNCNRTWKGSTQPKCSTDVGSSRAPQSLSLFTKLNKINVFLTLYIYD